MLLSSWPTNQQEILFASGDKWDFCLSLHHIEPNMFEVSSCAISSVPEGVIERVVISNWQNPHIWHLTSSIDP